MKCASAEFASNLASVVFPTPGGPQKIMDRSCFPSAILRKIRPGPVNCSWPTNSSKVFGRMRSANGPGAALRAGFAKRLGVVGSFIVRRRGQAPHVANARPESHIQYKEARGEQI